MKVKITHTLDLNKVPEKVNDIIKPTRTKLEKTLSHLSSIEFLLSEGDADSVSLSRMHIDALRKSLASIDVELEEAHGMISGVDDYNQQMAAKQAMEQQLEEQEQARQAQMSQEHPPTEEVRKVWNPTTGQTEDAKDD